MHHNRYNKNKKRHRQWHSDLPAHTTLGMALIKAIHNQREELKAYNISLSEDWIKILKQGGKIKFTSYGAEVIMPPKTQNTPKKRIYLGE